jgi:polyisoprenoid-binding protein YceI
VSNQGKTAALGALLLLASGTASAAEYAIDPERTVVSFQMQMLGTVQRGAFDAARGGVALDAQSGSARIDIAVDAGSLDTGSVGLNAAMKGPDLLDVRDHPQIVYRAQQADFVDGVPTRIDGELTLRGVTRSVPLSVTAFACADLQAAGPQRCAIAATASFKRSSFGMSRYRFFGNDEVTLEVRAEGMRTDAVHAESTKSAQPQASIPFVQYGAIRNWQADKNRGLWIQDSHRNWYYAKLMGPCFGLDFAHTIAFDTRPMGTFDRFSSIIVPHEGRCAVQSFVPSDAPPRKQNRVDSNKVDSAQET